MGRKSTETHKGCRPLGEKGRAKSVAAQKHGKRAVMAVGWPDITVLPTELLCRIAHHVPDYMLPVLRLVDHTWHAIADREQRQRVTRSHAKRGRRPRFVSPAYRNRDVEAKKYTAGVIEARHARLLRWAHDVCGLSLPADSCDRAAFAGDKRMLRWLTARHYGWTWRTCARAAGGGHLALLQWLRKRGCSWNTATCECAAKGGHLHVLQWALDHGCPYSSLASTLAAQKGRLHVLQWLHVHHLALDPFLLDRAVQRGHLDVAQWLYRHGRVSGSTCTYRFALGVGNHSAIEWLHAQGYRWSRNQVNHVVMARCGAKTVRWIHERGCESDGPFLCAAAASANDVDTLVWLREKQCSWDAATCEMAAKRGHLQILEWAHANGCLWDEGACNAAAREGQLTTLQWLRRAGCPWSANTCAAAASGGHLDVIQWARGQGCLWDTDTTLSAVRGGYIDVLQWAVDQGCPLHIGPCLKTAAFDGRLDLFEWLYHADDRGAPPRVFRGDAERYGHTHIVHWIDRLSSLPPPP